MRDLKDVINQILQVIVSEYDYEALYIALDEILEKIKFKAPELIIAEKWWDMTYNCLKQFVIPPREELDYKILSIWTLKSIEDLKKVED